MLYTKSENTAILGVRKKLSFILDPSKTLKDQVYKYLHNKIINGEIEPGKRLVEQQIVEATGVSRSPIREAIQQLISEGLVSNHARGGVRVSRPSAKDFQYLYECRLSLEPLAAYYCALRITNRIEDELKKVIIQMENAIDKNDFEQLKLSSRNFHESILQGSENPFLIKFMHKLNSLILFYQNIIFSSVDRLEEGMVEHKRIYHAISIRDAEMAESLMQEHLQKDYELYQESYLDNTEKGWSEG